MLVVAYLLERAGFYAGNFLLPNSLRAEFGATAAAFGMNLLLLSVFLLPSLLVRIIRLRFVPSVVGGAVLLALGWLSQHYHWRSFWLGASLAVGTTLCRPLCSAVATALPSRLNSALAVLLLANLGGGAGMLATVWIREPALLLVAFCLAIGAVILVTGTPRSLTHSQAVTSDPSSRLWWLLPGFTFLNAQAGTVVFVQISRSSLLFLGHQLDGRICGLWFAASAALAIPLCKPLLSRAPSASAVLGVVLNGLAFALIALQWSAVSLVLFFLASGVAEILVLPATYREALDRSSDVHRTTVDWFALQGLGYVASVATSLCFGSHPSLYFAAIGLSAVPTLLVWCLAMRRAQKGVS